jgi:PBP1b-binding outer membrane lipoprotein LpoB
MKRLLLALGITLFLSACESDPEIVTATKQLVVMPDPNLFECPEVTTFPDAGSLDDIEVAILLKQLYKNNKQCHNNMEAIRSFLEKADKETKAANND